MDCPSLTLAFCRVRRTVTWFPFLPACSLASLWGGTQGTHWMQLGFYGDGQRHRYTRTNSVSSTSPLSGSRLLLKRWTPGLFSQENTCTIGASGPGPQPSRRQHSNMRRGARFPSGDSPSSEAQKQSTNQQRTGREVRPWLQNMSAYLGVSALIT